MFKSINAKEVIYNDDGTRTYVWKLVDTTFIHEGSVPKHTPDSVNREVFVLLEYRRRNLAVAKNIARLYMSYSMTNTSHLINSLVVSDQKTIDDYYPELEYGNKYFPCVARQLNQLLANR